MGCGIADILFWRDATCTTGTIRMTEKPKYGQTNGCAWRVSQLVVVGSFNLGLFKICRKRKAASLCPGLPVSASGQSREIRVLDLSPSSWWATSHSSRTKTRTRCPSKSVEKYRRPSNWTWNYTFFTSSVGFLCSSFSCLIIGQI